MNIYDISYQIELENTGDPNNLSIIIHCGGIITVKMDGMERDFKHRLDSKDAKQLAVWLLENLV